MLVNFWLHLEVAKRERKNPGTLVSWKKQMILFHPGFPRMKVYFINPFAHEC